MAFLLPELKFSYDSIGVIDAQTMELHHSKHHAAYTTNLNTALEKFPEWQAKSIEEILKDHANLPAEIRMAVINNGGGFYNHNIYWETMTPGGKPLADGALKSAIEKDFGSFESFKEQLTAKALTVFGSGWAWLIQNSDGKLSLKRTSFQNNPIMKSDVICLAGIDVWEHAYYLKHQNRRADYINDWFSIVDWGAVQARMR